MPLAASLLALGSACAGASSAPPAKGESLPNGLLLALSRFEVSAEGKVLPKPQAATVEILARRNGAWSVTALEDPASNVFHKAMVYAPGGAAAPGILTLGGTAAALKLWRKSPAGFTAETLWQEDFGGKFSRMRDAEILPLAGGRAALAVATHDQGVVAIVSHGEDGWTARRLDHEPDIFVHEIEVGDLDGDGALEVYATPSEPNLFDGRPQTGVVVRYAPGGGPRAVVADLGQRHAKEILVEDVDGDGRDELYVSVEAVAGGRLEIRRYVAGTDPAAGEIIARLDDQLCRFLTSGDGDDDGRLEIVAAAHKTGLWLLRPPRTPGPWEVRSIDRESSGFEHAAVFADLDGDGTDELYVASDDQGEVRRYLWRGERFDKEVLHRRAVPGSVFTWNLMPVPLQLVD